MSCLQSSGLRRSQGSELENRKREHGQQSDHFLQPSNNGGITVSLRQIFSLASIIIVL